MSKPKDEASNIEPPEPKDVAKTYAEVAQRASRLLAEHVQRQADRDVSAPGDELGIAQAFMDMMARLLANPYQVAQAQMNLVCDYFSLWQHSMLRFMGMNPEPVATPAEGDKRFNDEQWETHFLFDFVKQSYLISARHVHDLVSKLEGLDEPARKRVNFFTRQYIDALSPSNFTFTRPKMFSETVKTQGQNLIKGFGNLLRDIEDGDGSLRNAMTASFEVGKTVATTPGKVIFENELMQLLQFAPSTQQVFERPLLIVPPWINKYYIMDLREQNSLIKWLTDHQHTVFVISWVNPDLKLAQAGFDDYLLKGVLTAVDKVCEQCGTDRVNGVGYCIGGTLLAIALSYMAANKDKRLASGTFLATMLDYAQPGELGVFIDEKSVAGLEKRIAEHSVLDSSELASTFNMLRANDLVWSFVVDNYLLGKDPFPFDLLFWNSDSTRIPARMHSFYLGCAGRPARSNG